jgi:hypothetical protein
MPEHIRSLIVILALATLVFWLTQKSITTALVPIETFRRRRNAWFAVTLAVFLSHNFWIYSAITALVAWHYARRDENPLALYLVLLFAAPQLQEQIPGFGLINYIFDLDHVRLLNLVILMPMLWRKPEGVTVETDGFKMPDRLMLAYIAFVLVLQGHAGTLTAIIRLTFYLFVDVWLPYYAFSRGLRKMGAFRDVSAMVAVSLSITALIGVVEVSRRWLLYDSLRGVLNLSAAPFQLYLTRGDGGLLRALAIVESPIILGYLMMLGLGLLMYILPNIPSRFMRFLAVLVLCAGLGAALSRGPWVGAVAMMLVILGLGPGAGKRIAWLIGGGTVVFTLLLVSPLGKSVIDLLPFVGTVDEGNVVYRQRLFELSMLVLSQNPFLGAFDYINNPLLEEMRQGQGIIDIVNTYIAVALGYGVVGVTLFVLPFLHALLATWSARRASAAVHPEVELFGRVLLGCLVGILVTIATVSSIGLVPTMYWAVIGMCAAYAYLCKSRFGQTTAVQFQGQARNQYANP